MKVYKSRLQTIIPPEVPAHGEFTDNEFSVMNLLEATWLASHSNKINFKSCMKITVLNSEDKRETES